MKESSCCSSSLPGIGIVKIFFLDVSHFNGYVVVFHCCLSLLFYNEKSCGVSFHMLVCHVTIFFGEVSIQIICSFSNGVVYFLTVEF